MTTYWTQFAKNLNPNSSSLPAWAPYSSSTDVFQSLIPPTPMPESTFNAEHNCSVLWDLDLMLDGRACLIQARAPFVCYSDSLSVVSGRLLPA